MKSLKRLEKKMGRFLLLSAVAGLLCITACTDSATQPTRVENTAPATPAVTQSTPIAVPATPVDDGVPRISLVDAKKDFDAGKAVFIDTHAPEQFAVQHIQGAINIPTNNIGMKADMIPKGKKIIAYCS